MQKVSKSEIMQVNGGATYKENCRYCGKTFKTTYWGWSWLSLQSAKVVVGGKRRNHEYACMERYF